MHDFSMPSKKIGLGGARQSNKLDDTLLKLMKRKNCVSLYIQFKKRFDSLRKQDKGGNYCEISKFLSFFPHNLRFGALANEISLNLDIFKFCIEFLTDMGLFNCEWLVY